MRRPVIIFVIAAVALSALLIGCAKRPPDAPVRGAVPARPSSALDKGIELFKEGKYGMALPFLELAAGEEDGRSEAGEWLAAAFYRLRRLEDAAAAARRTLVRNPRSSYAHSILADSYNPQYSPWPKADADTTWTHLHMAVACDSSNGSAWMGLWNESIRRAEPELTDTALRAMVRTGFLTPTLIAYNRWVLWHLPANALLLTNGDMDTFPALALQVVEGFRTDVVVVNRSLLNTTWYVRHIRDRHSVPLPYTDAVLDSLRPYYDTGGDVVYLSDQIFGGWLEMDRLEAFPRPITVAVSVPAEYHKGFESYFTAAGPYRLFNRVPAEASVDTAAIRLCLEAIDPDEFTGSLVSPLDRSPVRIAGTNSLVANVTVVSMQYAMVLLEVGRGWEAYDVLTWAEEFEKKTVAGPIHAELLANFKAKIEKQMPRR